MFLAMAYGLAVATALMVLALLWLGWEQKRGEAKAERAAMPRKPRE
jgi:hypothetical protein